MDHIAIAYLIIILIFLIILSAFFSGSEIGMMALNRYRLRHLAQQKQHQALRVSKLLKRPDRLLGVILIGNTFANVLASAVATMLAVHLLGDIGLIVATILLTLLLLIFAEITPKTFAALYPQQVAWFASRPLVILLKLFSPFVWLANTTANGLLRLLGINVQQRNSVEALNEDELRSIVHETEGLISDKHKRMLLGILDLEKVVVEDIMVPRNEIVGIDLTKSWDEIREQIETSQYARLPIYNESIEQVQGIIHLREIAQALSADKLSREQLLSMTDNCYFVPETTPLHSQLLNFQKCKRRMCLVVNEYGDIQGLSTLDDILEEIVGEFTTDIAASRDVVPQADGSVIVDGSVTIRELNRIMNWTLPVDGPKTMNGVIIEYLEFIPTAGTSVLINDHPVEIMQIKDNMIKSVKIKPRKINKNKLIDKHP